MLFSEGNLTGTPLIVYWLELLRATLSPGALGAQSLLLCERQRLVVDDGSLGRLTRIALNLPYF